MTQTDFLSLTPVLIVAIAPVIIMLTLLVRRNYQVIFGFSVLALAAAFASLFLPGSIVPHQVETLFVVDQFSLVFLGILYLAAMLITVLSYLYLGKQGVSNEEYYIVLLVAVFGSSILVMANHFVTLFLGIETLSISLYILIAFLRNRDQCIEAGVKYLVMASVASAFLLFGMGLIYTVTGTMSFGGISAYLQGSTAMSPILIAGFVMFLAGIGFKLALVPFHMWTPDVYQGAPAPVSAFIAAISKGAVLAVSLRFFIAIHAFNQEALFAAISIVAVLSMFTGNLLALRQNNLKRLLAFSSIAHLGYLLLTLLIATQGGVQAAIFYVTTYILATLGAFGVISLLSGCTADVDQIEDYKGLFRRNPLVTLVLALSLLSLAGIPLTAGFIGKFYLVLEGARASMWLLVISLIVNTVISLYYYLKVISKMFASSATETRTKISVSGSVFLALIAACILFLGVFPSGLLEFLNHFPVLQP